VTRSFCIVKLVNSTTCFHVYRGSPHNGAETSVEDKVDRSDENVGGMQVVMSPEKDARGEQLLCLLVVMMQYKSVVHLSGTLNQ